ncbi:MAG: hypothetical protein AB1896_22845 [Thermodesulfobacteriota bacterium]
MKKIPLDQARPGMILAQKLVREDGVLLAQKGAALTEGLLRVLERLSYETVPVESGSTESPEERAARLAAQEAEIEVRFARVAADPVLVELKAALLARLRQED